MLISEHFVRNNDTFAGSQTGCNVGQGSTDDEKFLLADNGDVDVRHERPLGGQEALEHQVVRERVDGRDAEQVGDELLCSAFRDNQFLDDGMYLSTLLVCECMRLKREAKTLSSLLEGLKEPVESVELRLDIKQEDFRSAGKRVIEAVMEASRG